MHEARDLRLLNLDLAQDLPIGTTASCYCKVRPGKMKRCLAFIPYFAFAIFYVHAVPSPQASKNATFTHDTATLDGTVGNDDSIVCEEDRHNLPTGMRDCMTAVKMLPRDPMFRTYDVKDYTVRKSGGCEVSVTVLARRDVTSWFDIQLGFTQVIMACSIVNLPAPTLLTGGTTRVGRENLVQLKVRMKLSTEATGERNDTLSLGGEEMSTQS